MSCCNHCLDVDKMFDRKTAKRDLKRYQKKGPDKSTRLLLDVLRKENPQGKTLIDVGGGIGVISFELFADGITGSVHVDASTGYLETCRKEAEQRNLNGRMKFMFGDYTDLSADLNPADIVTLDRVVCCYPNMVKLIETSAGKALGYIGLVYPRNRIITRIVLFFGNLWFRIRRLDFRTYLHPPVEIDRQVQSHGFSRISISRTFIWEVVVYKRGV